MIELEIAKPLERSPIQAMMAIAMVSILFAHVVMIQVSARPDLEAQTPGDRAIRDWIIDLPENSIIYTETAHWGILYDVPSELGVTSFPSLGLLTVERSIQSKVEKAIIQDDVSTLKEYDISHAFTSPRGQLGHVLAISEYWALLEDVDGSRLWQFVPETSDASAKQSEFIFPEEVNCSGECEWRPNHWYHADSAHLEIRNEMVPFFKEGQTDFQNITLPRSHRDSDLLIHVQHSGSVGMKVHVSVCDTNSNTCSVASTITSGGHETTSVLHHTDIFGEIEIYIEIEGGGAMWFNPAGLSGRSDRILDEEGAWLHWVEVRNL